MSMTYEAVNQGTVHDATRSILMQISASGRPGGDVSDDLAQYTILGTNNNNLQMRAVGSKVICDDQPAASDDALPVQPPDT